MRKLTNASKYKIVDGYAVIYMVSKATKKWTPAFEYHLSCIDIIKQSGKVFGNENVHLIPFTN